MSSQEDKDPADSRKLGRRRSKDPKKRRSPEEKIHKSEDPKKRRSPGREDPKKKPDAIVTQMLSGTDEDSRKKNDSTKKERKIGKSRRQCGQGDPRR
jgi:hypothetical protein